MRSITYPFEGEQLTVAQIHALVPALSPSCIRNHLAAGRNTRQAMLSFNSAAASVRGGRRTAQRMRRGEPGMQSLSFTRETAPGACY